MFPDTFARSGYHQPWSWPSYIDARSQLKTFDALAGYTEYSKVNLESPSGPVSLASVQGTANFFTVFGINPLLGRTFVSGEDQLGHDAVVVLSYEAWQSKFGGQADVIGRSIRLDGVPSTVIGVMPAGFRFPLSVRNAIYKPLVPDPKLKNNRGSHWMRTVGLLKPGVTRQQAQAELTHGLDTLARCVPRYRYRPHRPDSFPLRESVTGQATGPLKILLLAVFALLGIACVNVAGLLLARGVRTGKGDGSPRCDRCRPRPSPPAGSSPKRSCCHRSVLICRRHHSALGCSPPFVRSSWRLWRGARTFT